MKQQRASPTPASEKPKRPLKQQANPVTGGWTSLQTQRTGHDTKRAKGAEKTLATPPPQPGSMASQTRAVGHRLGSWTCADLERAFIAKGAASIALFERGLVQRVARPGSGRDV